MSNFARVFYANALAAPVMALIYLASPGERALVARANWGPPLLAPLLLSCVVGVAMSHSSYLLRASMSAATAALVGIACKLLSVVLNILIWDKHAGPVELAFLAMGMAAAAMYQQAPLRKGARAGGGGGAGAGSGSGGGGAKDGGGGAKESGGGGAAGG
jgi:solute carrier family 35 protein